ncbi:hypothetical protein ACVMB1_000247 [Bradyrhizobium sp. USDA 4504]
MATTTVERMAKLWQIEKTVRGQSPDTRVAARQQASAAIVADLFDSWQQILRRISGKSKLAEAVRYAVSRRAIFERFLTDGRITARLECINIPHVVYVWGFRPVFESCFFGNALNHPDQIRALPLIGEFGRILQDKNRAFRSRDTFPRRFKMTR